MTEDSDRKRFEERAGEGPDAPVADERGDDDQPDPAVLRRRQAEGAAGDLARMGIDPGSLGLGGTRPAATSTADPAVTDTPEGADAGGAVVPLRPEFTEHPTAPPAAHPTGPSGVPTGPTEPSRDADPASTAQPAPPPTGPQARQPLWRADPKLVLRSVVQGLLTPDSAVAMQDERALVEAVRRRQSDRRVVAFVAGKGGVGCTTAAVATGTTFVAMRDDRSVVVDVQQGSASLGALLGAGEPVGVAGMLTSQEVVAPPAAASGLRVVDGADWDMGMTRADVGGVLERLGSEHTFNLLDVGDDPGEGGHTALARADQVVAVTGPGEVGAAALRSVLQRVRRVNPAAAAHVVTVIVCPHEDAHRRTLREVDDQPGVVVVPPEPTLRSGSAYDAGAVSGGVREAFLRVAAGVAGR